MPTHTHDLDLAGRLLIWSLRHWLRARMRQDELPHFVLRTLAQLPTGAHITDASEALFAHLLLGAKRPLRLAAPETARLTRDEADLVWALVACQRSLGDEAPALLAAHQHRSGLRTSARALARLASLFTAQGLSLLRKERDLGAYTALTKQRAAAAYPARA